MVAWSSQVIAPLTIMTLFRFFASILTLTYMVALAQAAPAPSNDDKQGPLECAAVIDASQPLREVIASFADYSPRVTQCFGTCYFESFMGAVQDEILKRQRAQGLRLHQQLMLGRLAPAIRLLHHRAKLFLETQTTPTPESVVKIIDGGTIFEMQELFQQIDLPLFPFSYRNAYTDVSSTAKATMLALLMRIYNNLSHEETMQLVDQLLLTQLQHEFDNKFNAPLYFKLMRTRSFPLKSSTLIDLSTTIRWAVSLHLPTIVLYRAGSDLSGPLNHGARLAGYTENAEGRMVDVIILDSNVGNRRDNGRTYIPIEEMFQREAELKYLEVEGEFINRENATPTL